MSDNIMQHDTNVQETFTEQNISIYLLEKPHLSVLELASIDSHSVERLLASYPAGQKVIQNISKGNWFYFNRLNVPSAIRKQGKATLLMNRLTALCDLRQVDIVNTVSPSGDMNMEQLIKFYCKHGFEVISSKGLLVRTVNKPNSTNSTISTK